MINLIGNAIKFTEEGEITIGARLIERGADGVVLRFAGPVTERALRERIRPALDEAAR